MSYKVHAFNTSSDWLIKVKLHAPYIIKTLNCPLCVGFHHPKANEYPALDRLAATRDLDSQATHHNAWLLNVMETK